MDKKYAETAQQQLNNELLQQTKIVIKLLINFAQKWCGERDSNPRTPTRQPPQGCAFDLAWQPPHVCAARSNITCKPEIKSYPDKP